jgi:hypothetical protein
MISALRVSSSARTSSSWALSAEREGVVHQLHVMAEPVVERHQFVLARDVQDVHALRHQQVGSSFRRVSRLLKIGLVGEVQQGGVAGLLHVEGEVLRKVQEVHLAPRLIEEPEVDEARHGEEEEAEEKAGHDAQPDAEQGPVEERLFHVAQPRGVLLAEDVFRLVGKGAAHEASGG